MNKRTTGTGQQAIDLSPMVTPVGLLLASDQNVTSTAVEDIARIGVGCYDGTNQGAVAAIRVVHQFAPSPRKTASYAASRAARAVRSASIISARRNPEAAAFAWSYARSAARSLRAVEA